jgi:hypothetical protein
MRREQGPRVARMRPAANAAGRRQGFGLKQYGARKEAQA